jgi:putative aldouronate transport system permease protein
LAKSGLSRRVFLIVNYILLTALGLTCILPFIHVAALSFSSARAASANEVTLWPVDAHIFAYKWVMTRPEVWRSIGVSMIRIFVGGTVNMTLVLLTAFPLAKEHSQFPWRTVYAWFFFITMLVSGGLIPAFLIVKYTGIMNTIWALVLPGALPVGLLVLMLNFMRRVPKELEQAALIDGAGYVRSLVWIYIPMSLPAIATLSLFSIVMHWNSWFDGIIYMNSTKKYPFQSYLRSLVAAANLSAQGMLDLEEQERLRYISDRTLKAAQIVLGTVPILIFYPYLQKYFTKGIVLGSVKG